MRKIINNLLLPVIALLFSACTNNTVFNEQSTLPEAGWSKDSTYAFSYLSADTLSTYTVLMNIRHNKEYQYQNFWLFIDYENPDKSIKHDTIECYLADNAGKWFGSGIGGLRQMSVLIDTAIVFNQAGTYQIELRQAMRDSVLVGINDIGLEIIKKQ